jgi:hypothetical protein
MFRTEVFDLNDDDLYCTALFFVWWVLFAHCCINVNRYHCWLTLLQGLTSYCIIASVISNTIVAFDTIVAFVAVLTPMWRVEQLWNFSVLHRLHLSILVILSSHLRRGLQIDVFRSHYCYSWHMPFLFHPL